MVYHVNTSEIPRSISASGILRDEGRGIGERVGVCMSDQGAAAEIIDGLHFVPDPAYPYPFRVAVAPHFWMTEQSGVLADAVEAYFQGEEFTPAQRTAIVVYMRQYVERAVLLPGVKRELLLQKLQKLRRQREFEQFADELAAVGIEPF